MEERSWVPPRSHLLAETLTWTLSPYVLRSRERTFRMGRPPWVRTLGQKNSILGGHFLPVFSLQVRYLYVLWFQNSETGGLARKWKPLSYGTQARKAGDRMTHVPTMAEENQTGVIQGHSRRRTRPNLMLQSLTEQLRKEASLQSGTDETEDKKQKKSYSLQA